MPAPRIHYPHALEPGAELALPAGAARHVQVLRLQPGEAVCLFPGADATSNLEFTAHITEMGRQHVMVRVGQGQPVNREAAAALHLAVGMPTNDRMDWLVEKATELGVARITPLMTERSVLRLKGERTEKKQQHWQAIAVAGCEQCGRNTVPVIDAPIPLRAFLQPQELASLASARWMLSFAADAELLGPRALRAEADAVPSAAVALSGPEGGLSDAEEALAREAGFQPVTLGPRTLRAETAPLALCAWWALQVGAAG